MAFYNPKGFIENALETFLKNKIGEEKAKELKDKINIKNGGDSMVIENLERIWDDTYIESSLKLNFQTTF